MSNFDDSIDKLGKIEKKINQFSDILNELSTTEDKKKLLWKEIYENAINDVTSAYIAVP